MKSARQFLAVSLALAIARSLVSSASASSITVSVSQPVIYAAELSNQQLKCEFSHSPVYALWYYSSSAGASDRAKLAQCFVALGKCNVGDRFSNWTNIIVGANGSLSIAGVTRGQDGYFECEGFDDFDVARAGVRLFVLASESAPALSVAPSTPAAADTVTITCSVSGWNPPANITWTKTLPGYSSPTIVRSGVDFTPPATKFGRQTSTVRFVASAGDDRSVWSCNLAQPGTLETGTEQIQLRVEHKPSMLPVQDIAAIEGSSVSVICQANGYPGPRIQLLDANGTVLQESAPSSVGRSSGATTDATFQLAASSSLYRSQSGSYACRATNSRGVSDNVANFRLNVLYPPTAKAPSSFRVNEGDPVLIDCSVSGNPLPTGVQWRHSPGDQVVSNVTGTGLYFARAQRQQTGEWRCEVEAVLATTAGERLAFSATAAVQLTVQYAPAPPSASSSSLTALAGTGVNLTCRTSIDSPGEPLPSLRWQRVGVEGWLTDQAQLVKQRVSLSDSGQYSCQARNSLGSMNSQPVSLQVVQSPQALSIDDTVSYEFRARQGDEKFAGLTCRVAANPQPMIRWWRRDIVNGSASMSLLVTESGQFYAAQYEIGVESFQYSSKLLFRGSQRYSVQLNDTGEYMCEAVNELGALQLTFRLTVEVLPKITNPLNKVAVQSDSGNSVSCSFISHRPVSVWWINPAGERVSSNATAIDDSLPWQLISRYPHGNNRSLGNYTCLVNNSLGSDQRALLAVSVSRPDPPLAALVRTKAWDRIELTWTPGFDGGLPARLQVACQGWNASSGGMSSFALWTNFSQGRLELSGLFPDTAYLVNITPVNDLGKGLPYQGGVLAATTGHLRLPALEQPRWDRVAGLLAFRPGDGDCPATAGASSDGCHCARLQVSNDGGDTWQIVLGCSPLVESDAETQLKLENYQSDDASRLYRVSLCLKIRPDVCGAPYTTYSAVSSQLATVSVTAIILVTCVCAGVVAILILALACLCVRRCGSSNPTRRKSGTATQQQSKDSKSLAAPAADSSSSSSAAAAASANYPSASIRSHRPQVPSQFIGSSLSGPTVVQTDRSSNQTQETCLDSGSFSFTNGSSASPVPHLSLQQQLCSFGMQQQQQLNHVSYGSDVTDSGCYFSASVSPPPPPRKVIYEVVV